MTTQSIYRKYRVAPRVSAMLCVHCTLKPLEHSDIIDYLDDHTDIFYDYPEREITLAHRDYVNIADSHSN